MFIFLLKTISPMLRELMNSSSQHQLYFPEENIQPPQVIKSVLIMRAEEREMPSEVVK